MPGFEQAIAAEIAALERELEAHPVYVKLRELKRVRSLYAPSVSSLPMASCIVARSESDWDGEPRKKNAPPMSGKTLAAINAAIDILDAHCAPLRTVELLDRLAAVGITFTGASPKNTLSTLLSRATEVESRGGHLGWALKKWNSAEGAGSEGTLPPADDQPDAKGREAGPGGGP
jgi:hypothetical protein